jgi:uroporphyrinogen decarboxylase
MNHRERALAVLNYQPYDRIPIVHFGYWDETLDKWAAERHITKRDAEDWRDGNDVDRKIGAMLGFDFDWAGHFGADLGLKPGFRKRIVQQFEDGSRHVLDGNGAVILEVPGVVSIPTEIDHLLKGRSGWEKYYKPRLQWNVDRMDLSKLTDRNAEQLFGKGGRLLWHPEEREVAVGIWCGSLYGKIRDYAGIVNLSYLLADDPMLVEEMIETVGELCYQGVKAALEAGFKPDFGHFWEDICYRAGPLVNPRYFHAKCGPHYRRITELLHQYGVHIVSLDCDGKIDALIPTWFENGVNTMFPIEVGVWHASIAPWREKYGRELRGVGGVDKKVLAYDYAAVDAEVERQRPLVELGGYIPCLDHRIAPDAKWENVQHYCERMRRTFGG